MGVDQGTICGWAVFVPAPHRGSVGLLTSAFGTEAADTCATASGTTRFVQDPQAAPGRGVIAVPVVSPRNAAGSRAGLLTQLRWPS